MGTKPQRMFSRRKYFEFLVDSAKAVVGKADLLRIRRCFNDRFHAEPNPGLAEILDFGREYLDERSEPLAVIALAHINHLLAQRVDGLINIVGFQCMIHSIVLAHMKSICERHGNPPVLTLSFDLQEQIHQRNRLEAFMYQVRQYRERTVREQERRTAQRA